MRTRKLFGVVASVVALGAAVAPAAASANQHPSKPSVKIAVCSGGALCSQTSVQGNANYSFASQVQQSNSSNQQIGVANFAFNSTSQTQKIK
jgi:hypothetical protein